MAAKTRAGKSSGKKKSTKSSSSKKSGKKGTTKKSGKRSSPGMLNKAKKTIKAVLVGAAAGAAKGAVSGAAEAGSKATGIGGANAEPAAKQQNASSRNKKGQSKSSKKR
jgi:hypothetical protein